MGVLGFSWNLNMPPKELPEYEESPHPKVLVGSTDGNKVEAGLEAFTKVTNHPTKLRKNRARRAERTEEEKRAKRNTRNAQERARRGRKPNATLLRMETSGQEGVAYHNVLWRSGGSLACCYSWYKVDFQRHKEDITMAIANKI